MLAERLDRPPAGTYAFELIRALREAGHDVFLLLEDLPGPEQSAAIPARLWRHLGAWSSASMRGFLVDEMKAFGPAVVHAASTRLGTPAREIARRIARPSVVTVHAAGIRKWLPVDLDGHHVIATGESSADDLAERLAIARERLSVVPPGVRVTPRRAAEPGPTERIPVIGAFGELEYAEGHRFLLEAAHKVIGEGREAQVLIAGEGPEKAALRRQAAELGIADFVTFVEQPSRPRDLIAVMDVFVDPTTREALSPMLLEAMAEGKPVVAGDARDARAVAKDGLTALVVSKGDSGALADAIGRLLTRPDFASRLAREAREAVRRDFSVETMAARTVDVYRALRAR